MRDGSPSPTYRPAVTDDLPACTRIWRAGLADYLGRLNADDGLPYDLEPLRRMLAHFLITDPERFWVAVRHDGTAEQVVGFGSANIRGGTWFLAMLFVDPAEQRNGVGSALLDRTLTGADGLILGTATDSAQPISNGLYAARGIVPRMPCLLLIGRPRDPDDLPRLPSGIGAVAFEEVVAEGGHQALVEACGGIDRALLGYERPSDHAWLRTEGRRGYLYRDATGRPVGYGYLSPVGRIGPVAALDDAALWPFVGHLLMAHIPAGASSVWVPGQAGDVVRGLLRVGLRFESFPALFCWTEPLAAFDRYVPITLALV